MKTNPFILATCTVALFMLTACGGGSSGTAVNDVVMYKYISYDFVDTPTLNKKTYAEALSIGRDTLTQHGIFVLKEECGNWKVPGDHFSIRGGINHLITVSQTQADSVQSLGYEKYLDKGELDYRSCDL